VNAHVRDRLFEYLSGELPAGESAEIEKHLRHCAGCTEDLQTLRKALEVVPRRGAPPSDERDEQFWTSFPSRVQERINAGRKLLPPLFPDAAGRISSFLRFNAAPLLAGSGVLAAVALAFLLLRPAPQRPPSEGTASSAPVTTQGPDAALLHNYLKRSRVLLIGVSNLRTDGETPIDLGVERTQSRALVHEARDLRKQTLDPRSARVVDDVEKILIELANGDARHDAPDVEIIRSGIRRDNLLFRIRMTEAALAAAPYGGNTR
jgi:hypothetical protein